MTLARYSSGIGELDGKVLEYGPCCWPFVSLVPYSSWWSIAPGKCHSCEQGTAVEVKVSIRVGSPVGRFIG